MLRIEREVYALLLPGSAQWIRIAAPDFDWSHLEAFVCVPDYGCLISVQMNFSEASLFFCTQDNRGTRIVLIWNGVNRMRCWNSTGKPVNYRPLLRHHKAVTTNSVMTKRS